MLYQGNVDATHPHHYDLCIVRGRRLFGLCPGLVFEALCQRGDKLEVLGATCKAPDGSAEAANALRNLSALLRHDGWEETEGAEPVSPDIIAHYIRRRD